MIKLLNKYKKHIIMISFAYIYMLFILIVPSGFSLLTPGDITTIDNVYDIENVEFNNNLNTVSVLEWHELTTFQKWLVDNSSKFDVYKQYESEKHLSLIDLNKQGTITKESSHDKAIITAYTHANKLNNEIAIDYKFKGLTVYNNYGKYVSIGDLVVKIDDIGIDDVDNYYEFILLTYKEVEVNGVTKYQRRQNLKLQLENGDVIQTNYQDKEFIDFEPKFEIINTYPKYNQKEDKRNVGGPSGGAMQTLAIYSALLNINYKDIKVAGTGTIEPYNDKVGIIGGIVQKYYTVIDNKVDIFFVPTTNYNEIKDIIDNKKIKVYPVDTFDDIIEIMREYE